MKSMPLISNFSILLVEDDEETQERMKMMLEDDVREFYQAFNGEEGLKIYKEKKPDIILSDISMPIMDGLTMSKEIKSTDKCQPIIILSAFDDRSTLFDAVNIGIDSFIPKPIDVDMLYEKLYKIAKSIKDKADRENTIREEISKLYDLAHYDTLTQVPNRFLFNIKLDEAIEKAKIQRDKVTLFFIDLDNFKLINDTYGHSQGDKVLQTIAGNIKKIIRSQDTIARIGGDEFALIILSSSDEEYIDKLAQRIIKATTYGIELNNKPIEVTCSIGISQYPDDANSKNNLIHFADQAMYRAKGSGKRSYCYHKKL